jgi:fatty-acid desaturase
MKRSRRSAAAPATAAANFYIPMPPVVIGGGDSINFHLWYPAGATTAPTYEFDIGWWER